MIQLALFCVLVKFVHGENINLSYDTNYPIIITDKFMTDSYFGTTVALTENKSPGVTSPSGWIFIGAPKSGYTNGGNDEGQFTRSMKPGVLWRCSLGRREAHAQDTCEIVRLDDNTEKAAKGRPLKESKAGNLLGISLSVGADRLVTCSPKWVRGTEYLNGLCYWLNETRNTDKFPSYTEDELSIINPNTYEHRLIPFFIEKDAHKYQNVQLKSYKDGQDWSLGQAGMSVHISDIGDEKHGQRQVLIGAPGVRLWSGAVAIYTDRNIRAKTSLNPERIRANRNNQSIFSEYVVRHRTGVSPVSDISDWGHFFEYFGYAVASGKLDRNTVFYVGGSPRGNNLNGEAVVFRDADSSITDLRIQITETDIITILRATKENFGSYFGSVLHSVDIFGNDGVYEIFVGAPMYGNTGQLRKQDHNSKSNENTRQSIRTGDHGAVYIFQYSPEMKMFKELQIIRGHTIAGARFGSAISSVVKVSSNHQIKQLVIGSPYENCLTSENSCGAIYIYEPVESPMKAPEMVFKLKIEPSIWRNQIQLRGFGSSLSLGVDIDENQTPDLVVGAYKSQNVVVLRSRPPVKLEGSLIFRSLDGDKNSKKISKLSRKSEGVKIESCVSRQEYENFGSLADRLEIQVKLTVDKVYDRFFYDNNRTNPSKSANFVSLNVDLTKDTTCDDYTFRLRNKASLNEDNAKLYDIKIIQELTYVLKNTSLQLRQIDIENAKAVFKTPLVRFMDFQSKNPSTTKLVVPYDLLISPHDCKSDPCKPNITLTTNWFHSNDDNRSNPISTYTIGSKPDLILEIKISNTGETALKPTFRSQWKYTDIKDHSTDCRQITNPSSSTRRHLNCVYTRIASQSHKIVTIKFDMRYLYAKDNEEDKNFIVNFDIKQAEDTEPFSGNARLALKVESKVSISGPRETSALTNAFPYQVMTLGFDGNHGHQKEVKELYSPITQRYEIHFSGVSAVDTFTTIFQIPVKMKGSKEQLLLVKEPMDKQFQKGAYTVQSCESLSKSFHFVSVEQDKGTLDKGVGPNPNPTNDTGSAGGVEVSPYENKSRKRRSVVKDIKKKKPVTKKESGKTYLNCNDGRFECMEIQCKATRNEKALKSGNDEIFPMSFDFYLVKSLTDLLKAKEEDEMLIETKGRVMIFSQIIEYEAKDEDVGQTLLSKMKAKVKLWVYFVAALIALLLLAIIIFSLYKFGFFKREVKEKLKEAKADERRKSMMVPRSSNAGAGSNSNYDTFGSSQDDLLNDDNTENVEQEAQEIQTEEPEKKP